jgi:N-acetylneuraminate synthase/N,N'-diacetyllegionaminate synthase
MSFYNLEDTFVIAEIGGNHEGDLDYAKRLLFQAANAGANAVKFQSYSADGMVSSFEDPDRHKHFKKFSLQVSDYIELSKSAGELGVMFMSSIWDSYYLQALNAHIPIHKIGSGDLTNYPLIKEIIKCNKPLIISTAMADLNEVKQTISFINSISPAFIENGNLCVMQCVAMYGAPSDSFANLNVLTTYKAEFPGVVIGYSDHTEGYHAANIAVSLGAKIIEVHFTDDKTRDFRDHHISIDAAEMKKLIADIRRTEKMLGSSNKSPVRDVETEERITEFRRACYFTENMSLGDIISEDNMTTLRPNKGVDARKYFDLIGKKVTKDIKAGQSFLEDDLE